MKGPKLSIDDSSVAAPIDNNNHRIIDLWDDVERKTNPVAKIVNSDLWLSNDEDDINALLNNLIWNETSPSDFLSFVGPTVIIIIIKQFKINLMILFRCCEVILFFVDKIKQLCGLPYQRKIKKTLFMIFPYCS